MIREGTRTEAAAPSLAGLRGWLVLVGIAFSLAPLRILKDMLGNAKAFEARTWSVLTTPGTPAYHPLWAPLLIGEMVVNVVPLGVSEIRGLVQAAVGAAIWIPYFLVSARVRATFVR